MHLLARGAATAVTLISLGANAADLDYPAPLVGQPQYGMVSPPPASAPQVVIIPGSTVAPQYRRYRPAPALTSTGLRSKR